MGQNIIEAKAVVTAEDQSSKVFNNIGNEADNTARRMARSFDTSSEQIRKALNGAALALGAVGGALTLVAKDATDFTVDYVRGSKQIAREIGTTVEEASRLQKATERLGISVQESSQLFGIFSKSIKESSTKSEESQQTQQKLNQQIEKTKLEISLTNEEIKKNGDKTGELGVKVRGLQIDLDGLTKKLKESSDPLTKLGVNTKTATGIQRDFSDILLDVADRFKAMPAGVNETTLAMELFGRSGKDMLPFLNLGREGIQKLEEEADKLGLTLTPQTVGKVEKFIESQKRLKERTDAIKLSIGTLTTPVLTSFNEKIAELVQKFLEANGPMKGFVEKILAFGGPVAVGAASLLGFAANLGTVITSLTALGISLGTVALIIGVVIVAIAALAAIAYVVYRNWDTIREFFADTLPKAISAGIDWIVQKALWLKDNFWQIIGAIIGIAATLPIMIPIFFIEAFTKAISWLLSLRWSDIFSGIWEAAKTIFDKIQNAFVAVWQFLHDLKWSDIFKGIATSIGNAILAMVEGAVKGALKGLPGNIERNFKLPRFASGVTNFQGGLAVVGERGKEIVNLPRGADVIPNSRIREVASTVNNQSPISITIQAGAFMGSQQDARKYAMMIMQAYQDAMSAKGMAV